MTAEKYHDLVVLHYPDMSEDYAFAVKILIDLGLYNSGELQLSEFSAMLQAIAEIKEYIEARVLFEDHGQLASTVCERIRVNLDGPTDLARAMNLLLHHFLTDLLETITTSIPRT